MQSYQKTLYRQKVPIATLFFDRTVNFFLRCTGDSHAEHGFSTSGHQRAGALSQGGPGGADVVHQQNPLSGGTLRLIDIPDILTTCSGILQAGLGRGVGPLAQEPLRFDVPEPTGRPGQQLCLVIAPLAQPFGTDGNPGNGIKFAGEMLGGTSGRVPSACSRLSAGSSGSCSTAALRVQA